MDYAETYPPLHLAKRLTNTFPLELNKYIEFVYILVLFFIQVTVHEHRYIYFKLGSLPCQS